ncbi:MAG: hypothetical protein KU38_08570 [Sulfurovum sp. FS08-3]|nr:MAG: hypothetical protein KU38_08570 [Sulfurovum sp. FS08-3]
MPNDPTPYDREPLPISSLAVVEIAIMSMVLFGSYFYVEALCFYIMIAFVALAMVSTPSSNQLAYSVFMREIVIDNEAPLKSLVSWIVLVLLTVSIYFLIDFSSTWIGTKESIFRDLLYGFILCFVTINLSYMFNHLLNLSLDISLPVGIALSLLFGFGVASIATGIGMLMALVFIFFLFMSMSTYVMAFAASIMSNAGMVVGLWLRSVVIKIAIHLYTLCTTHPIKVLDAIATNYYKQTLVWDSKRLPRLFDVDFDEKITLEYHINLYKDLRFAHLGIAPIWKLGYLYRAWIKSMFVFYLPLVLWYYYSQSPNKKGKK